MLAALSDDAQAVVFEGTEAIGSPLDSTGTNIRISNGHYSTMPNQFHGQYDRTQVRKKWGLAVIANQRARKTQGRRLNELG